VTPRVLSAPRRVIPGRSSGGVAVGLLLLSAKITIKGKIVEFNGPDMRAVGWDNNLRIIGIFAKQVYWDDGFHVGSVNHKHNRTLLNLGLCLPSIIQGSAMSFLLAVISHSSEECPL